jgi:hypothetical protein
MTFKLKDTRCKIAPAQTDDITVKHLDRSMKYGAETHHMYNEKIQLITRHLYQLMILRYRYNTVISSAGAGAIFKLEPRGHHFQGKVIMYSQLQCYCYLDAEIFFYSLVMVSLLKFKTKEKQLYIRQYGSFESIFDPCYISPDSPFK